MRVLLMLYVFFNVIQNSKSGTVPHLDHISSETTVINNENDLQGFLQSLSKEYPSQQQNVVVNDQTFSYKINNKQLCNDSTFLLILIKTTPDRIHQRQDIRTTWAAVKHHNGAHIVPVFIMGKHKHMNDSSDKQKKLMKENVQHGDILQGDFIEHVKNQTYKSIMGLTWAKTFCSKAEFILNTNDDTMVDPFHLIDFLLEQNKTNFLYCSTFYKHGPSRNPADELFVTMNDYPYSVYPPYCERFAYIISNDVLIRLLEAAKSVPFLWHDEVYVTGLLAAEADVNHTDMSEDHGYNLMQDEHVDNDVHKTIFLWAKSWGLRKNWYRSWEAIEKQKIKRSV